MEDNAESPNPISPDLNGIPLSPGALRIRPNEDIALAVWGTCQSESFCHLLSRIPGIRAEQFGFSSGRHGEVPAGDWKRFNAVVVNLAPRQLLNVPEERLDDLSYVREFENYSSVLESLKADLVSVINRAIDTVGASVPIFFLAFFEPPATAQGILLNNRRASIYHLLRTLNDHMAAELESRGHAFYIETNDLVSFHGSANVADTYLTHFTHAGFQSTESTDRVFRAIADRVRSALAILRNESPVKLIVTDLDNTLWRGVLAEDIELTAHERVEGWPLGYMEALLEFRRRGGLLAICSKNSEEIIREKALDLWRGALKFEDFCSVKINWNSKSRNIREILAETNVLASNTLFIDDSVREIHEVNMEIPAIRCLGGNPEAWRSIILNAAETQVSFISGESARRSQLVEMKQRRDASAARLNRDEYLRSLKIHVRFDLIENTAHPKFRRAAELLNKTNQFNTTGKRWVPEDLHAHFSAGGSFLALTATDSLGDNGLVALAVTLGSEILQLVLSCRMFGFSLESALLYMVLKRTRTAHKNPMVTAQLRETSLNSPCRMFYANHGFHNRNDMPDIWTSVEEIDWPAWIQREE